MFVPSRPLPEDDSIKADILGVPGPENQPNSPEVNGNKVRKKLMAPDLSLTLDPSDGSVLSDDLDESGEIDLDGLDTPSENSNEFEWEDDLPKPKTTEIIRKGSITEYTAAEEQEDGTLLAVTRPFISSKFSQKIRYVFNMAELAELVPKEYVGISECIKQVDQELNGK
ncbi:BCL2/adenovirus E1B 19 kDa protein-interacting protein 2 [Heterocephalus glaber]|uniref:BCL2/adenovirus E1B 19 kDa protein-interacting protein 2 n=1 Tax=Heterocephalus glaber TaxID=10181 RepID=G5C6R5_HETGA|nr:BCL2/adenovirus E1B 19 kDa protein-interacting protein 2 [Heterocephalus glaber]